MRLLQVATVDKTLEGFLLPFASRFRARGWTVGAMANGVSQNAACREAFDRVHEVGWSRNPLSLANAGAARVVARTVAEEGYDIVHVHTPVAAFVTRLALRRRPRHVRVVYTAHGFHFHEAGHPVANWIFRALERVAAPWTDELVVINGEDHGAAIRSRLVPEERLHFVPGIGIDLESLDPARVPNDRVRAVREEIGVPPNAPLFLMLAEFTPNKRHVDALRAFAGLKRHDGAGAPHLALAGVGPEMADVKRLGAELGVADRVHFLGYRRDAPALIRAASAVLLTSLREGLPRSVMESMALGTPVVATAVRGVRDLVGDGRGLLVEPGNVGEIQDALEFLIDHPEAVREMAVRAQAHLAPYDVNAVLDAYEAIYERLVKRLNGGGDG